ncbi:phosphate ABC transporter permease subunit PstC [Pyrobaculum neutrophilum]|uniref:Phosphate transport system permease protein n=1 Tax=Pyrobaculum neutrophilum (strain DSM 2338 / JCM 9278 / NBRC 100436 / V24Sta) TaxID=444157 RepID=B1YBS9_PYRNV|nr:phosphate ABC transporter permease subunit PstC [Pyrobaculum neutrophilum]ACB39313.1 phosphate ABC transporter, inner membrane subunit PstC [Pyrobaculum neutrophilum V24Sta]
MTAEALILLFFLYAASALFLFFTRLRAGLRLLALAVPAVVAAMVAVFLAGALPALSREGLSLFTSSLWSSSDERYGLLGALWGTFITTAVALPLAAAMAVSFAVFVNDIAPAGLRRGLSAFMDLTAAVPTVVYGLWGAAFLTKFIPPSLLAASLLLAAIITPYAAAVIREGYASVPREIAEAVYSLGATKFEAALVKLRYIRNYVLGGVFLALGRAVGETVAVSMVVGGNPSSGVTLNLLSSGVTVSSLIALQMPYADATAYMKPALMAAALLLAAAGLAINAAAVYLLFKK